MRRQYLSDMPIRMDPHYIVSESEDSYSQKVRLITSMPPCWPPYSFLFGVQKQVHVGEPNEQAAIENACRLTWPTWHSLGTIPSK